MKSSAMIAAFLVAALSAQTAGAESVILGKSDARTCFEAARAHLSDADALDACNKAVAADAASAQDRVGSFVNRGIVKMAGADFTGAITDFDAAIAMDPREPEAFLNKGIALLKRDADARTARAMLDAAIEKRTVKPELAYYARGIAEERIGDVRGAYRDYRKAAALAPTWEDPRRELARFRIVGQS